VLFASNNVPAELIHAAGCFPLQLPTAPGCSTDHADRYLEARFDPLVRAALAQLLAGELSLARLVVLPRTNDSWQRLYYYLCELGRSFGERLPEPVLYDLLHTPYDSSADYNLESTRRLAEKLAATSGKRFDEAALAGSISLYNRIRAELGRLLRRRWELPARLAGADALELFTASQRLDPEVFASELPLLLAEDAEPVAGVRTLLIGSAHDTPQLHRQIERAGGQVVADFHPRGDLTFGPPIREDVAPLQALCEHYHRQSLGPRTFPPPTEALLELAAESRAEAAVFFYYAEEEALTWDYPAQRAALSARGIATLLLDREAYPPDPGLEPRLSKFFAGEGRP
jgi:benzoyl-CoA reductase/2-hydroxyglutaryl-CoA dehydratase subunit BcrC/BadD/HgdB